MPAEPRRRSSSARAALRLAGLVLLFLGCLPLHLIAKVLTGRSPWPSRFLAAAAWIIGARVRVDGAPLRPHSLLTPNHISWLDILVMAGATGCRFVSKDQLGHPLVHWLADQNATIYVRRSDRRGSHGQALEIADALAGARPVALFPEGTTGPGDRLLPFRSTLFEAARRAARDVEVRPVALDYGAAAAEIAWHGESAKANVLRILGRRGMIPVVIHLLPPLDRSADRKQLAEHARDAIDLALRASDSPPAGL